jgi:hypothetical protein
VGLRSRYRKAREEGSGNSPRASMGFSKPRIGFSRDWEIYRDEEQSMSDERGLLPSRARFRFAGWGDGIRGARPRQVCASSVTASHTL